MLLVYQFSQVNLFIYCIYIVSYFEACLCRCLFFVFIPSLPVCLLMAKEWSDICDEFPLVCFATNGQHGGRLLMGYSKLRWCWGENSEKLPEERLVSPRESCGAMRITEPMMHQVQHI